MKGEIGPLPWQGSSTREQPGIVAGKWTRMDGIFEALERGFFSFPSYSSHPSWSINPFFFEMNPASSRMEETWVGGAFRRFLCGALA